jgi:hypothetical protein
MSAAMNPKAAPLMSDEMMSKGSRKSAVY